MRELIKNILKEYVNPILVYEIVLGKNLINERDEFIRVLDKNDKDLVLFKNKHSQINVGDSTFSRVDPKFIDDSIRTIQSDFIKLVKRVSENCVTNENCKIIVIDKINGFDYQCWIVTKKNGNIGVVINTSIHHPKRLFNSDNGPTIIIETNGQLILKNFP